MDLERGNSLGGYAQFFAIFGTRQFMKEGDIFAPFYRRFRQELEACAEHIIREPEELLGLVKSFVGANNYSSLRP